MRVVGGRGVNGSEGGIDSIGFLSFLFFRLFSCVSESLVWGESAELFPSVKV